MDKTEAQRRAKHFIKNHPCVLRDGRRVCIIPPAVRAKMKKKVLKAIDELLNADVTVTVTPAEPAKPGMMAEPAKPGTMVGNPAGELRRIAMDQAVLSVTLEELLTEVAQLRSDLALLRDALDGKVLAGKEHLQALSIKMETAIQAADANFRTLASNG